MATVTRFPRTWLDVAIERGAKDVNGAFTGDELARVGITITNGCPRCHARVAPSNSYQVDTDNPYAYCARCAGVNT